MCVVSKFQNLSVQNAALILAVLPRRILSQNSANLTVITQKVERGQTVDVDSVRIGQKKMSQKQAIWMRPDLKMTVFTQPAVRGGGR